MRLEDNPEKGRKVWLSESDVSKLTESIDTTKERIAIRLMLDSGLRTKEVLRARPTDVKDMDGSETDMKKLRVLDGKGDKYRETWIPNDLAESIRIYTDLADIDDDEHLIDVRRQTVQRWIRNVRDDLQEQTDDEGWKHLTAHDLRRTWGTRAIENDVLPTVVMQAGGWEDFKTFQEHYMGVHGDSVVAREASKVL